MPSQVKLKSFASAHRWKLGAVAVGVAAIGSIMVFQSSAATECKSSPLRQGARGNCVKLVQKYVGVRLQDGVYGAGTRAKVIEFQRSRRLVADGVVGSSVWNAICTRVAKPSADARAIGCR